MDIITRSLLDLTPSFIKRNEEYARRWAYYKGNAYLDSMVQAELKKAGKLKAMQEVYNCITQAVDIDARFVMKKELGVLCQDGKSEWEDIIVQEIWERSSFQKNKYKLVRTGANLGDTYLIVQELDEFPFARIIVANSEDMQIFTNPHDQDLTDRAHQHYNFYDEQAKKARSWDKLWLPDREEVYIDGVLQEEYSKEYKYFTEVPVIHIKHLDIGESQGLHTWHSIGAQVDAVNELASYLWLIMQRYGEPTMIASGPTKPDKLVRRDGNIIYTGMQGDLKILEYQGNILPQIITFSGIVTDYIQNGLPELSLNKIRDMGGNISGYAVSMHLADMVAKIDELRGNYADGIEYANSLALKARLKSNAPIEEFQNDIIFEPILPEDELSKWTINQKRLELQIESRQSVMREQGLTEDEIEARFEEIKQELESVLDVTYPNRIDEEFRALGFNEPGANRQKENQDE